MDVTTTIKKILPFINVGLYLNSIAKSLDYCREKLGIVGVDFSDLLLNIFENKIIYLFSQNCKNSLMQFESALKSCDWYIAIDLLQQLNDENDNDDINQDETNGLKNITPHEKPKL